MVISVLWEQSICFVVPPLCSSVQGAQQVPCVTGTKQILWSWLKGKCDFFPLLPQSCSCARVLHEATHTDFP